MDLSEDTLVKWTKRSSQNEKDKQEYTVSQIRAAILSDATLEKMYRNDDLSIYTKGSYANNTNVRLDSDVDVVVERTDLFYFGTVAPYTRVSSSPYTGPWTEESFWQAVQKALVNYFDYNAVDTTGNSSIQIDTDHRMNIHADVVPCSKYKLYFSDTMVYEGTRLKKQDGTIAINYPAIQKEKGNLKNNQTGRRYKRVVRIIKRLENEMVKSGYCNEVPSYLLECLVYNCDNRFFEHLTYRDTLVAILHCIADGLINSDNEAWTEPNEIKLLFAENQKWDLSDALRFIAAALKFVKE
jgi:hypothetical protein